MFEKKEGETRIKQLELSANGDFLDWPEGFFDEGYKEALALAIASQKSGKNAR